jgi:hypothetical protein
MLLALFIFSVAGIIICSVVAHTSDPPNLPFKEYVVSRVQIIDPKTATGPAKPLLDAVQAQLGITPNFMRVLANSPKALEGFLGLYGATAVAVSTQGGSANPNPPLCERSPP